MSNQNYSSNAGWDTADVGKRRSCAILVSIILTSKYRLLAQYGRAREYLEIRNLIG